MTAPFPVPGPRLALAPSGARFLALPESEAAGVTVRRCSRGFADGVRVARSLRCTAAYRARPGCSGSAAVQLFAHVSSLPLPGGDSGG